MADQKKFPDVPERATRVAETPPIMTPPVKPRTRTMSVKLEKLILRPDDFSHRAKGSLEREALQSLIESIKTEGLRHPPEGYSTGDGKYVVVTGNRRITCLNLLASDGVAGFSKNMEVEFVELLDTTPQDRLAWSVADNQIRLDLTPDEVFEVVKNFVRAGMPDERGASALGLSLKQYQRDLSLVRNEWMLDLVTKDAITATTAVELLEAAAKKGKVEELKKYLWDWVAAIELEIESQAGNGQLKPAQRKVRSRLTPDMKRHWLDLLKEGKELNANVKKKVKIEFDPKTLKVSVQAFELNLATDSVVDAADVLGTLSQIAKTATPILKTRLVLEGSEGPQAKLINAKDAPKVDQDFLKQVGLTNQGQLPKAGDLPDGNPGNETPDKKERS